MPDNTILALLENVFRMSPQEVGERIHSDFYRYYSYYFAGEPFDPYVRDAQAVIAETGWEGKILDVGCGFGVFDICLHASGVKSVVGADVVEEKTLGATRLAELLGLHNLKFTVASAERLPFPDAVFDGVLIKDAVSHLPASTCCYSEAFRVLRPGGSLLIIDDRNGLNPLTRWHTKKVWRISEFGDRKQISQIGLKDNLSELRRRYIRDHFSDLSDRDCRKLAVETRGLLNSQIAEFVAARGKGSKPPEQYAQCVNPENAMIQERLSNPFGLSKQLKTIGFETKVLPPPGWRAESSLLPSLGRMLWPISAVSTAYFQILATRR
jgi:ubiquinone/menaquinone biosynthesis C-methylase UbiE